MKTQTKSNGSNGGTGSKVKAARRVNRRATVRVRSFVRDGGRILAAGTVAIPLPPSSASAVIWGGAGGGGSGGAATFGRAAVRPFSLGAAVDRSVRRHGEKVAAAGRVALSEAIGAAEVRGAAAAAVAGAERRGAVVVAYAASVGGAAGVAAACAWRWDNVRGADVADSVAAADGAAAFHVDASERRGLASGKRAARRALVFGLGWSRLAVIPWQDEARALRFSVVDLALSKGLLGRRVRARVQSLAEQAGRAWCARFERMSGRVLDDSLKASGAGDVGSAAGAVDGGGEVERIFRRHFLGAVSSGAAPSSLRALYTVGAGGTALPWGAWLTWRQALRDAGAAARSFVWGKGAEVSQLVSVSAPTGGAEVENSGAIGCESSAVFFELEKWGALPYVSGLGAHKVRALSVLYGERLTAFWALSGSRKWKSALATDLGLLRALAGVAMGRGVGGLGDYLTAGGEAGDALRKAASELRKHLSAGKALIWGAETMKAAGAVIEQMQSGRAARRAARRGAAGVRAGDIVGSAQ